MKSRHSQKCKDECHKIAMELRSANPQITIAASIEHLKRIEATLKPNGAFYTDKVVRNWIKGLWPDEMRKGGRPKKGT